MFNERLTKEQLLKLPTPRLLRYYKKNWRAVLATAKDYPDEELYPWEVHAEAREYAQMIKSILDTREHVND